MKPKTKSPNRRRVLTREILKTLSTGVIVDPEMGQWEGVQGTGSYEYIEDGVTTELVARTLQINSWNPLIDLSGLKELPDEAAFGLATFLLVDDRACIGLRGITEISLSSATSLARFQYGRLILNGLGKLRGEVAIALGNSSAGWMELNGLTSISPDAASGLASFAGELELDGLATLDDEAAEAFSKSNCAYLSLSGVTTLSPNAASSLARKANVSFTRGLTTISPEVAEALVCRQGGLVFHSLRILPPKILRTLAGYQGALELGGLSELSNEQAKILATRTGELELDGLSELSNEQAKILATHTGKSVSLLGIKSLTFAAVKALSVHQGRLRIGLKRVSDDSADVLASRKGELFLSRLTVLADSEAGRALADKLIRDADHFGFDSLTTLSEKVAERFAKFGGSYLQLNGLTSLSENTAKKLAMHRGEGGKSSLALNGLRELSHGAATALAGYQGALELASISELSDAAASALAEREGARSVFLRGLKRLSPTAAECLTCPDTGPIKIPENLRVTDVRQVAALEGDPDREFIVALSFYFCEVSYSGFRVMSRDQIRKLVRGLDSGAKIGAENMPGSWDEEFDVGLMANSFRIHSGRRADVAAMKLLFGDSVGQTDYFQAVCDAADRANQKEVEENDEDDDE